MKILKNKKFQLISFWGLKLALALAFLSAVADRFGFWGEPGTAGVVWGNFENFTSYTQILIPWSPSSFTPVFAWLATLLEIIFGFLLLTKFKTKEVAFLSGMLLCLFGISMIVTVGPKAALDYSVFSAAFGAFFLASQNSV